MAELTTPGFDFQVRRDDYHQTRILAASVPDDLAEGQVLFRVDRFALGRSL